MPEELNRILIDHIADLLFTTEPAGAENLRCEGIEEGKVHFVGNTMIDSLFSALPKAKERQGDVLARCGVSANEYGVVTLHRPTNVDDAAKLAELLDALQDVAKELPLVFPVHPRTRQQVGEVPTSVLATEPLGYLDFVALVEASRLVLTDSGGIQEETTALRIPCVTIRDNTERPITVDKGTNVLAGTSPSEVVKHARLQLANPATEVPPIELWDGAAGSRIVSILARKFA